MCYYTQCVVEIYYNDLLNLLVNCSTEDLLESSTSTCTFYSSKVTETAACSGKALFRMPFMFFGGQEMGLVPNLQLLAIREACPVGCVMVI